MEEKLIECDLLIRSIQKKFYNVEKEDLYQAGCLGLIKAYNNYTDPNIPFSSYAYKYIFGEMYELYLKTRNIKTTKSILKMQKSIIKASEYLSNTLGRNVTDSELSEYLNISIDELNEIRTITNITLSLDDEEKKIDVGIHDDIDAMIDIKDSLSSLDPLSSEVMNYRINSDFTQSEIAELLGISQVKVSRIEKNSKNKILEYIQ